MATRKSLPPPALVDPAAQAYELVPLGRLREHPENPRRGDVDGIGESIDANGFFGAVVVQRRTRRILAGNHRYRAARARGMKRIPVLWVDVDDERALKILLADNAEADKAEYDTVALADVLQTLVGDRHLENEINAALAGTGYDAKAFDSLLDMATAEKSKADDEPPPADLAKTYVVAVECETEQDQARLKARLTGEGYKVTARRLGR